MAMKAQVCNVVWVHGSATDTRVCNALRADGQAEETQVRSDAWVILSVNTYPLSNDGCTEGCVRVGIYID